MMEEKLEQELGAFDFSLCHSVRESLLGKLLAMHRKDNAAQHGHKWAAARLDEDELDWVAAAGNVRAQAGFCRSAAKNGKTSTDRRETERKMQNGCKAEGKGNDG